MLKPNHIKQIIILSEIGSVNQAANILHMTQPSLTNSIKKMEHQLGVPLFERTNKGMRPTLYADYIVSKGKQLLADFDLLHKEIQLLINGKTGKIHIGCGPVIAHTVIHEIVYKFNSIYPDIEVNIHIENPKTIIKNIKEGIFDIGLISTEYVDIDEKFSTLAIHNEHICFMANSKHPILKKEKPTLGNILEYPLALPQIFIDNMSSFKINLSEENIKMKLCLVSNDYNLLINTVINTNAITAAPKHLFNRYKDNNNLVCIKYLDENIYWNAHAVFDPIRMHSTSTKLFLDMVADWFKQEIV